MPIAGVVSDDTSSWTSSSTTEEMVDDLHLEDTFMSDALIIYRPLGRTMRPPYLIQAMHSTHINNLVVVMQHWQDLRYHPWRIESVHPTYGDEYPQSDETHIYVVVALCDLQSPLHQVVLNVVQTLDTTLQRALPLPPYVERDDILQANRVHEFCRRPHHTCRVYKNGQLLPEGERRTVAHGDYIIRTTITNELDEAAESQLAESFQVSAQAEGLEQLDETGLAMLDNGRNGQPNIVDNRPRPSQASSNRGPNDQLIVANVDNPTAHDRADYWTFMAVIMYVAAFLLGRQMYQPRAMGKTKRKLRRLDKTPSNAKILRTLTLVYLVVGAEALAINAREGRQFDGRQVEDIEATTTPRVLEIAMSAHYLVCREPVEGLPPPGNPPHVEEVQLPLAPTPGSFLESSRTEIANSMVARICLLFEGMSLTRKLSEAQRNFRVQTTVTIGTQDTEDELEQAYQSLCGKLASLALCWGSKVTTFTEFADPSEAAAVRSTHPGYVAAQMEDVAQQDHKQVLRLLKPMRVGRRVQQLGRKPLPMIQLEDGSTAENMQSAQDRWRRHFAKMEGGTISSASQLLQDQKRQPQGGTVEADQLPTIFELERQMMKAKAKKAMGPDGVPPEILKHAAAYMSYHYWPLFAKISLTRQESLQFKGGRLVAAYKQRGATTDCGSYRALLVSSSLAKSFHSVYRKRSLRYVQQGAGQLQFTSHRSPSVGLAAHIVRLHQQAAQRHGRSSITLFLDIKEAFYCVIRQHSMPATFEDQDIFRFLHRMGVRDMHIQQVATLLSEGPTLEALGCDEHLLEIITEFHRGTWFHLATDVQGPLVKTEKGTRPGDGFADVLWALTFAKWLVRLEDKLAHEGVLSQVEWNGEANLHTSSGGTNIRKGIIAWADDVAVLADSVDPLVVVDKLTYITEMLVRDLLAFGMTPNFGLGKTEVVADIRGKGSHIVKRKLFNENKGHLDIHTDMEDQPRLRAVPKYKHLGGFIVHGARIGPEIQHRIAQGRQACADYRTKIYGNKAIPLTHRLQVLKSTAITTATYNAGCWPRLNQKDTKLWTHGILSLYRIALQKTMPHLDLRHLPDRGVLGLCQALHPITELRILRLRHYAQYIRRHYPLLRALIAQEEQWKEQLQEDFQWLYDNIRGLTVHPPPRDDLQYWTHMIQEQHSKWKGILRRVTLHATLQYRIQADVDLMHRSALRMLQTFGVAPPLKQDKEALYTFKCFICDRDFESYTGWAVHAFKKHGRTHPSRQVQEGRTCRACGKTFNNAARLTRHFKSVPRCASTVATHLEPVQVQPGFGSKLVVQEEAANALQIWMRSGEATLPPGDTWVATPQAQQLLHLCRTEGWHSEEEAIMDYLKISSVSHGEITTIQAKLMEEELENQHALQEALHEIALQARAPVDSPQQEDVEIDGALFLQHELQLPDKVAHSPTVYRYVLHVFSGVRREGDLHSALLAVTPPDGTFSPSASILFCQIATAISWTPNSRSSGSRGLKKERYI